MSTQSRNEDNGNIPNESAATAVQTEVKAPDQETASDAVSSTEENKFSRANVEGLGSKIRLVDSDEETGLDLFCYTRCTMDDDDFLKQCRGLVFHGDTLVMKAFPYTHEYHHEELETLENVLRDFGKWSFYNAHEGALLRMFFFSGRWYLSTHRKLNAFRSKWASRDSFGTLFKRALESEQESNPDFAKVLGDGENILDQFQNTLDRKNQYMFLLCNSPENRIVCEPPKRPTLFHVGTFRDGKLDTEISCGISYPDKLSFMNIDQLLDYVKNNIDYKTLQGIVCFGPGNVQVKVLHRDYQDLFRARGNEPSIKYRYLQVRMDKRMTNMLYHLYGNMADIFDDYEDCLYDIASGIYKAYVQRFIKHKQVTVPHEEFQIVRECHSWHLSDRENNRISMDKVISVLNKQPPTNLNHMIRRFKTEQSKKKDMHPRSYKGSRNNSPALAGMSPSLSPDQAPLVLKKGLSKLPPPPKL